MSTISKGAFSLREFQHWAGIGRTKALSEIAEGRLHAVRVGRKLLIPVSSAEAWLEGLWLRPHTEITLEN